VAIMPKLSKLIGRDVRCSTRAQEGEGGAREKRGELIFGGEKEHNFVRRFPGFALSSF
jgi:hypothetical protein